MMAKNKFKKASVLTGQADLDRILKKMENGASKISKAGLSKALTVSANAMRAEAPTKPFKASIGKRNKRNRRKGIHEAMAGIHVAAKGRLANKIKNKSWLAHIFVLGTKQRHTKFGHRRGRIKPIEGVSFVKRAAMSSANNARAALRKEVWRRIKLEAAK